MASFSSHDQNDVMLDEEIQGEEASQPDRTGKRRTTTERSSSTLPPKGLKERKKMAHRSEVWNHFTQKEEDLSKCNCRYCGIEIGCDTKIVGTSPMRSHIARCKLYKAHQECSTQKVLSGDTSGGVVTALRFDKGIFRKSVNVMIVLNELPFAFVESKGFKRFCHNVIPIYTIHCRKTATTDINAMFMQEKESLKTLFGRDKQRVSLTTDIWVAPTTSISYMVVISHWIDTNWELQKRILNFKPVTDHKGDTISAQLIACLEEWGIEKIFTVTMDNAKGNDKALRLFTDCLCLKGENALVRDGAYLHMCCCAHILNLVVRDGLAHVRESVIAIRNTVKYVRSSGTRLKSFELRVETRKCSRGSLSMDCITRWNSTYLMLTDVSKLRVVFEKMLDEDMLYNEYFMESEENGVKRVGPPTSANWDEVQRFLKFLIIFFNCTLAFLASKTVTSSSCYNEIVTIERNLISLSNHAEEQVRSEAKSMREKFEKYWDGLLNLNPLVIIGSVFDPRNKMKFASHCFDKLYGKDSLESNHLRLSIRTVMSQIYEEYTLVNKPAQSEIAGNLSDHADSEQQNVVFDLSHDDEYERMDFLYSEMVNETANDESNSELDIYLMEKPVFPNTNGLGLNYDVLGWWKSNSCKYPILSKLAKDFLAIQVSSVASESAFSTSGRILDPYRSCLSPHMIEALICTQQWLRNSINAEAKLPSLVKMFEELDFYDSLGKGSESNI